ncbi:related to dityrosine transporter [Armillaria ostoyae]|uniref:Related to dityrosine transporter n=1 Tax=Armillaria ostoyae TaxID=47428 RepID=A0A284QXS3_ARMOS|nr:related to dityrosine transporter [Armillaria ostoyae]
MNSTPTKDLGFIPIPRRLRYDPARPFQFGIGLNVLFAFACTFMVANLFYCLPLLIQFSESFGVSYFGSSRAPTLLQAGYATGLFVLAPLGDIIRCRQLLLGVLICSTTLTLCLALVRNWNAFLAVSFFAGALNIVPPILLPLAADIAPSSQRAFVVSIIVSGLIMGILVARVVAGVIAQFAEWRVVYYFAVGVQSVVLVACYAMVPDYPAKNADNLGYWGLIKSMVLFAVGEPQLIQACLVNLLSSAGLSNFWVTLTFLLGGPPYNYSTLLIGLFGVISIFGVCMTPLTGRLVDKLHPWHGSILGSILYGCFQLLLVGAAGIHVVPVILATLGIDVFCRMLQVSLQMSIFSISAAATTRLNAISLIWVFLGQVMGADVGSRVFLEYGWRAGAGLSLGWTGLGLLILLVRGPHCGRKTWFGYEGGFGAEKNAEQTDGEIGEKGSALSVSDNSPHT